MCGHHCICRWSSEHAHLWSRISTRGQHGDTGVLCFFKTRLWLLLVRQQPGLHPVHRPRHYFPCIEATWRELHLCGEEPCDRHHAAPVHNVCRWWVSTFCAASAASFWQYQNGASLFPKTGYICLSGKGAALQVPSYGTLLLSLLALGLITFFNEGGLSA